MFGRLALRTKLLLAFALLAMVMAVDGLAGLRAVGTTATASRVVAERADSLAELQQTEASYARMRQKVLLMVIGSVADVPASLGKNAAAAQAELDAEVDVHLDRWRSLTSIPTPQQERLAAAIAAHREVIHDIAVPALAGRTPTVAPPNGADSWTLGAILGESDRRYAALTEVFAALLGAERDAYQAIVSDAQADAADARRTIALVLSGSLVIAVALGLFLARSIARPVGATAVQLHDTASELERAAGAVDRESRTTAEQAGALSEAAQRVEQSVETVVASVEEMRASIAEISAGSHGAARATADARQRAQVASTTVDELGRVAAEITSVATLIGDIAAQTNLLALNATIEAARAGEAGRGFAVVANEVKELAQQTSGATDSISRNIDWIREQTRAAVQSIEDISNVVASVDDLTAQIAAAIEEQSATTNEIARNVSEASGSLSAITRAITQVEDAARTTTDTSAATTASVEELRGLAGDLQAVVRGGR